jgi:protein TonB
MPFWSTATGKESATTVFNCVRGSILNKTSITIAIVDGKAGVPDAFRLGAYLVLTKPVSLEQAKGTLRMALGALRKEAQSGKALPASAAAASVRTSGPAPIVSQAVGHKAAQSAHSANPPVLQSQLPHSYAVDSPLEDDDPILAELKELESRHAALPPPTFRAPEKRRRNKAPLLVTVTVILVAAGFYAVGTTQPRFRNLVTYEYRAALRRIAEFRTKPQAIASATPAQPAPYVAQRAAAPLAPPSAAQTVEAADTTAANSDSAANPASTSSAVADAKASPPATSLQDAKRDDVASSTAAVPALVPATSTTQRASSDTSTEPVVLPENVAADRVMRSVRPVYPKRAQRKRVHGVVVLQVVVNKDGKVDSMQVINGNPLLARAAMDAVRQRRYKPYFRVGEAAPFETQVTVDFRLP